MSKINKKVSHILVPYHNSQPLLLKKNSSLLFSPYLKKINVSTSN